VELVLPLVPPPAARTRAFDAAGADGTTTGPASASPSAAAAPPKEWPAPLPPPTGGTLESSRGSVDLTAVLRHTSRTPDGAEGLETFFGSRMAAAAV
jgi:hypothetical protein